MKFHNVMYFAKSPFSNILNYITWEKQEDKERKEKKKSRTLEGLHTKLFLSELERHIMELNLIGMSVKYFIINK